MTNIQTAMKLFMGKAPNVNDQNQLDDIQFKLKVTAKTVDYTVLLSESGTLFTTEGATEAEIEFTLPAPTAADAEGAVYFFYNAEDIDMKITSGTADLMVAQNDVAATSVTFTATSLLIGGAVMIVGDGAKWFSFILSDGNTVTVA